MFYNSKNKDNFISSQKKWRNNLGNNLFLRFFRCIVFSRFYMPSIVKIVGWGMIFRSLYFVTKTLNGNCLPHRSGSCFTLNALEWNGRRYDWRRSRPVFPPHTDRRPVHNRRVTVWCCRLWINAEDRNLRSTTARPTAAKHLFVRYRQPLRSLLFRLLTCGLP